MSGWFCSICYEKREGESAPAVCPVCGADQRAILAAGEPEKERQGGAERDAVPETLEKVRESARRRLKGICAVYPSCDGRPDKICQREAYGGPIGFGGAGSGASFTANVRSLEALRLRTRLVGTHFEPDASLLFCGRKLSVPVMGASTAGVSRYNDSMAEVDFCRATIRGCREAGTLAWRGDTWFYTPEDHPGLEALEKEGGDGIPIFKPRAQDVLKRLIERAVEAGCPALGVDLDGCGSTIMARHGQPVFRKSVKDLRELVASSGLPFIAKGVMCARDAEACVEAGVRIIAVSNHGGRVMDHTPGVAEVLPEIVERVGGHAAITADGGVRTGYDVLKMLALGAEAVLQGRDVIRAAVGGGTMGVRLHMERMRSTLLKAMFMAGCANLEAIGQDVLI